MTDLRTHHTCHVEQHLKIQPQFGLYVFQEQHMLGTGEAPHQLTLFTHSFMHRASRLRRGPQDIALLSVLGLQVGGNEGFNEEEPIVH